MTEPLDPASTGPLTGVRVLDFTRVLSGPHCGRMLADLGADVIKVEPPDGDMTRFTFPRINSIASYFTQQNCGKRNISLDLKRPEAVELLRRLAARSDVVLENFRPGVMDRAGLGADALRAGNPRLVYCAITGYGSTGPWQHRRAYAPVIGAESGFTRLQGEGRDHLANDSVSHADLYVALEALAGILAALHQRTSTGEGQVVDVSMAETMLSVNEHAHWYLMDGFEGSDDAVVSFQPGDYPVFTTSDGRQVVVSGHPAERGTFERYCRGVGRPELIDDERFPDVGSRKRRLQELKAELQVGASRFADPDALERSLEVVGLALGVVRSVREIADSEWATARNAIVEVPDRAGGTIRIPNSPWHFSAAASGVRGGPKYRGEDNRAVLREVLDLTDAEIEQLEASGILLSRLPRPS